MSNSAIIRAMNRAQTRLVELSAPRLKRDPKPVRNLPLVPPIKIVEIMPGVRVIRGMA